MPETKIVQKTTYMPFSEAKGQLISTNDSSDDVSYDSFFSLNNSKIA